MLKAKTAPTGRERLPREAPLTRGEGVEHNAGAVERVVVVHVEEPEHRHHQDPRHHRRELAAHTYSTTTITAVCNTTNTASQTATQQFHTHWRSRTTPVICG